MTFINSDLIYISPRELSSIADPKIDYIEIKTKKLFNTIPIKEVGLFKNDIPDDVEQKRIKQVVGRYKRRLKSIKRMEMKYAADYIKVVEL